METVSQDLEQDIRENFTNIILDVSKLEEFKRNLLFIKEDAPASSKEWIEIESTNDLKIIGSIHHIREITLYKDQDDFILKFVHKIQKLDCPKPRCWIREESYSRRAG